MQIINDYKLCPEYARNSVIALGNFDGLHKGHKTLILKAKEIAKEMQLPSAVMTFSPHPRTVLSVEKNNFLITTEEQKISLLQKMNIDFVFNLKFDQNFLKISGEEFIKEILCKSLSAKHIVVGYNFIFGYKRSGNVKLLKSLAKDNNFKVLEIDAQKDIYSDIVYSSTTIRSCIKSGNIKEANLLLGRRFSIKSKVEHGNKLGTKIGFPTINLSFPDHFIIPKLGVYIVECELDGTFIKGVANIGCKPTIECNNNNKITIEVHLLNFSQNIYDKEVEIYLIDFIREEMKFASIDDLIKQITLDIERASSINVNNIY